MTRPGQDDQTNGLRRLPKQPQKTDAEDSRRSLPTYVQEPASKTPQPRRELFFERLPEPWTEDEDLDVDPDVDVDEPETFPAPNAPGAFALTPAEQQRPEPDVPGLYFRRASPVDQARESFLQDEVAEPLPRFRQSQAHPAATANPINASQPANVPPTGMRASGADPSLPERPQESSVPAAADDRSSDAFGGPKPASVRTSGIQRQRPLRPSGQYAAGGTSGESPVAPISGSLATAKTPGARPVARGTGELPVAALRSREMAAPARPQRASVNTVPSANRTDASAPRPGRRSKGKSVVGMVLASVALVAYAFLIGPLESAADAAASPLTSGSAAFATLLPWLLVVPAILLFGFIIWLLAGIIGLRRTENRAAQPRDEKPAKTPLNQFKSAAQRQGLENRTAYRGWRLLEAACGTDQPITLDSYLAEDLELSPREVRAVHLQLLKDLSRHSDPAMRLPPAETVLDLLRAVDAAPFARPASASGEVVIPGDPGQPKRKSGASS